jgi:hypothetical protein
MLLRKITAAVLAAVGVLMLAGALFLTVATFHGGTVAQWSGLCHGLIGQIGQAFSSQARVDCGLVDTAETAKGWLFGLGAASLAASVVLLVTVAASPQPGFVPGTPPAVPAPVPSIPPQPPAVPVQFAPQPVPPRPPLQAGPPQPPLPGAAVQPQMPGPVPAPLPPPIVTPSQTQPLVAPPTQPSPFGHFVPQVNPAAPTATSRALWERLLWPVTAVMVIAILSTGGVLAVRALNATAVGASSPVHAVACTTPAVGCGSGGMRSQPVEITVSADGSGSVNDLRWSGWGTATATATGVMEVNNCNPNCAQGTYTPYRATVTLSGLRPYDGGQAYSTMRITSPGAPYEPTFRNLVPHQPNG